MEYANTRLMSVAVIAIVAPMNSVITPLDDQREFVMLDVGIDPAGDDVLSGEIDHPAIRGHLGLS